MNSKNSNNYISLQEATKFCQYTQEYLSLRARQGKLKAVKFGRNWVTKKEWLEEYLEKVEEYNKSLKKQKVILPPENLPVEEIGSVEVKPQPIPTLKFGLVVSLTVALLVTGIVFGQESFKNVFQDLDPYVIKISETSDLAVKEIVEDTKSFYGQIPPLVTEFSENFDRGMAAGIENLAKKTSAYTYIIGAGVDEGFANVSYQATEIGGLFKEYLQWISQNYLSANEFVEEKLSAFGNQIVKSYFQANQFVEEKISQGYQAITQPFIRAYNFVTKPWRVMVVVPEKVVTEKVIEKEIVKEVEVERVTKIEPIREIEKITEVTKIDEKELAKLKSQITEIQEWERDIKTLQALTKKIQPHPAYISVPTAPVYIATQGLQVAGAGIFTSLGVTGSAGVGSLGVGGSTILGSDLADKLTVNATALFVSPVTVENTFKVGGATNYLTISSNGDLTTTGDISLAGNLTVSGAQNLVGPTAISYSGTSTALTVRQNGTGDVIQFLDGQNIVFKISDGGQLTLTSTSTPQLAVQYDNTKYSTLAVDSSGTTTLYSTGNIILDPASGEIRTTANFVDVGGATARAVNERVFRAAASVYRYGMPAETASTSWIRISKDFPTGTSHPLVADPSVLPGATRVYRLLINYSDDIATTATSSWRVATSSPEATIAEFSLPGANASTNMEESTPYLTGELPIPDDNWHIDVTVPSGKKIRVFNIFLLAYDRINQ